MTRNYCDWRKLQLQILSHWFPMISLLTTVQLLKPCNFFVYFCSPRETEVTVDRFGHINTTRSHFREALRPSRVIYFGEGPQGRLPLSSDLKLALVRFTCIWARAVVCRDHRPFLACAFSKEQREKDQPGSANTGAANRRWSASAGGNKSGVVTEGCERPQITKIPGGNF